LLSCSIERHTSVQGIVSRTGGVRPPARSRCATALTLAEREEISRATVDGQSIRSVAARLGRAPSTVSREIKRNGGQSDYRAAEADRAAWDRALRPKQCKLVENRPLARIVTDKLRLLWSPEQIAGWLKHTYPRDENQHVSHETIYRSLFIQTRGALKKELLQYLRRTRGMRRSRHHTQKTDIHGRIVGAVSEPIKCGSLDRDLQSHQRNVCQHRFATGRACQVQRRPPGAGAHIEQPHSGPERQQLGKSVGLPSGRPARGAVVTAKNQALDLAHLTQAGKLVVPRKVALSASTR
jgi:hypothetical protein